MGNDAIDDELDKFGELYIRLINMEISGLRDSWFSGQFPRIHTAKETEDADQYSRAYLEGPHYQRLLKIARFIKTLNDEQRESLALAISNAVEEILFSALFTLQSGTSVEGSSYQFELKMLNEDTG